MRAELLRRLALALVISIQPALAWAQVGPLPQSAVGVSVAPLVGGTVPAANLGAVADTSLPQAGTLTGSEILVINQGGGQVQTTLAALASLLGTTTAATGATLAGFPTTGTQAAPLTLTGASITLTPSNATAYAVLALAGADEGTRVAFVGTAPPARTPASSGSYTYKVYAASSGGTALATSPTIAVSAAAATAYTSSRSAASGAAGAPVTLTVTPTGTWPGGKTITPAATTLAGTWSPTSAIPTAGSSTALSFAFTPSSPAGTSGTLTSSASPAMANTTGALAYAVTAGTAPGQITAVTLGTPTPTDMPITWTAPASGGTPTGFRVELSTDGGTTFGTPIVVSGWDTYYAPSGLTAGTSYVARVTATNSAGNGTVSANSAAVSTLAAGANYFLFTAPGTATAGTAITPTYTSNYPGSYLTIANAGVEKEGSGSREYVSWNQGSGTFLGVTFPVAGTYTIRIYYGNNPLNAESRPIVVTGSAGSQSYSGTAGGSTYTAALTPAVPASVPRNSEMFFNIQLRNSANALETNGAIYTWGTSNTAQGGNGGTAAAQADGNLQIHLNATAFPNSSRYLWVASNLTGFSWVCLNPSSPVVIP